MVDSALRERSVRGWGQLRRLRYTDAASERRQASWSSVLHLYVSTWEAKGASL